MRSLIPLFSLLLPLALVAAGCSGSSGGGEAVDGSEGKDGSGTELSGAGDGTQDGPCELSSCPAGICDPLSKECVECVVSEHCLGERRCVAGVCTDPESCTAATSCTAGFCDVDLGFCVQCLRDAQCDQGSLCVDGSCVGPVEQCPADGSCPEPLHCHPSYGLCLPCVDDTHCLHGDRCGAGGVCRPAACVPGETRCDGSGIQRCGRSRSFSATEPCPAGQTCAGGSCVPFVCTPGSETCDQLQVRRCDAGGAGSTLHPCPPGSFCPGGEDACVLVRHRLLILFDTSGSMDRYPGTNTLVIECREENMTCPPSWPVCETKEEPLSVLSLSKVVFAEALSKPEVAARADLALMRFPQELADDPDCKRGYSSANDYMTGDDDSPRPPSQPDGWFRRHLHEVLAVPFSGDGDSQAEILSWMDFKETLETTHDTCSRDSHCDTGFCASGASGKVCHIHGNPELRAVGRTPIGRTLSYAGAYFRQLVLQDGFACSSDADCSSPGYTCSEDHLCVDPIAHCRKNVVLLFSDGWESVDKDPRSFFHPWTQARRFAYGLRCKTADDCLGGAKCELGVCRVPGIEADVKICSEAGEACERDSDCPDNGRCAHPVDIDPDNFDEDRIEDALGRPVRLQIHAIDVDVEEAGNKWIALLGGGQHFTVQSDDPENFLATLLLATDIKAEKPCVPVQ